MSTWRLVNKQVVEKLDKATQQNFAENVGTVESAGTIWEAYKGTIRGVIIAGETHDVRTRRK